MSAAASGNHEDDAFGSIVGNGDDPLDTDGQWDAWTATAMNGYDPLDTDGHGACPPAVCARTLSRAACQCQPAASSIAPFSALFYFSALPPPLSLLLCVCPAPAAGPSALGLVPLEDLLMFIFPFYPV